MSKRFSTAQPEAPKPERPKREKKKRNVFGVILLLIQLVLSVCIVFLAFSLKLLPQRLLFAGVCLLAILWLIGVLLQVPKGSRVVGKVLTILVILGMAAGTFYLWKTGSALNKVFNRPIETKTEISVVALKERNYEGLSDLSGKMVATQAILDQEAILKGLGELNKDLEKSVQTVEFNSYVEAAGALLEGEVDGMLLNESYREMLIEAFPDFNKNTKVLHATTVTQEVKAPKEEAQRNVDVTAESFTVYISGNDSYGSLSYEGGRSDVNILLTINPVTGQIVMTSTPRDLYVELPADTFGPGHRDKLTHAGIFGVDVSESILSEMYDIPIDYYVRINFGGFQDIVNALGGVTVYSDYAFSTKTGFSFDKGENYVDGDAALAFVRERYAFPDGDLQRGRNQMAMIRAIINKVTSPSILSSYGSLMDSLSNCFITDIPREKVAELVQLQLSKGIDWDISSNNITGVGDMQPCYTSGYSIDLSVIWVDQDSVEDAKKRIHACIDGELTD